MNHPFTLMGDLNVITVLYFAFFVFTVVLGTYVYVRNEGSRISLVFLLLTVSIAVLDLNEALYSWTTVRSDAFAFQSFKSIGYVFWWPLILHLLLLIRFERIGGATASCSASCTPIPSCWSSARWRASAIPVT